MGLNLAIIKAQGWVVAINPYAARHLRATKQKRPRCLAASGQLPTTSLAAAWHRRLPESIQSGIELLGKLLRPKFDSLIFYVLEPQVDRSGLDFFTTRFLWG